MMIESALLFAQLVGAQDVIGLALTGGRGDACVAMSATPGSVVTLVSTGSPQTTVTATVEESSTSCGLTERTGAGPYFRLRPRAPVPEWLTVWVAFKGDLASKATRGGRVGVGLSAAYPAVQVHDCLSSEGVHYTVWAGEPLTSQRLWHKYYYLGYDVEPSCKERSEVADP